MRFRRLSALTSVLLTTASPLAIAQAPTPRSPPPRDMPANREFPKSKAACDQLASDVLAVAIGKLGPTAFSDYLKASDIDRKLDSLCAEGNYGAAYEIAVKEISSFSKPAEPKHHGINPFLKPAGPKDKLGDAQLPPCIWEGHNSSWSATASHEGYTLATSAEMSAFDDTRIAGRTIRFAMDFSLSGAAFRYRIDVPWIDGVRPQAVDVQLAIDGGSPRRARVPVLSGKSIEITTLMPQIPPAYLARHAVNVFSVDGKPLMSAAFVPKPPGDLLGRTAKLAIQMKSSHDAGTCAKRQCFITTACCDLVGLEDTCFELTALRAFRDRVLPTLPDGERDIARYYMLAPVILDVMRRNGSERVLLRYYASHILPCAILARSGFGAATQWLYRDLMRRLMLGCVPHLLAQSQSKPEFTEPVA